MSYKLRRVLLTLLLVLMIVPLLTVAVYAGGDEGGDGEDDLSDILIPIPIVVTPEPRGAPQTLTPDGNMNLIDDVRVGEVDEKQFITVTTRNGNYFYIIIDRAGSSENVYFLNMVDELDLLALLEDDFVMPEPQPAPEYVMPVPPLALEPESEPEPEPDKDSSGGVVALVVFLVIGGIGAAVYFKVIKPKQAVNSGMNFDEFRSMSSGDDEFNGGGIFDDDADMAVQEVAVEAESAVVDDESVAAADGTVETAEETAEEENHAAEKGGADDFPKFEDICEAEDEEGYEDSDEDNDEGEGD